MSRPVLVWILLTLSAAQALAGEVTGVVRYVGKAPEKTALDRSVEPSCASVAAYSQDVVVDNKQGLEGVHVRIKTGTAGTHSAPTFPVLVRQKQCTYEPHVAGIMAGQELFIYNDDGFLHNVRAQQSGDLLFNRSQPKGAAPIRSKDYGTAGQVLELGCDVHRWMKAFVAITDHPFFMVTGPDGRFAIKGLPAGKTFTLEAWHPVLGLRSQEVKAGATKLEFSFP